MSGSTRVIEVSKEFSDTPGFRLKSDGPKSGEEFRERFLEPAIEDPNVQKIIVDLDNVLGYATSFLEEAFGGLARKYGASKCLKVLEFKSDDTPLLVDEIKYYIKEQE